MLPSSLFSVKYSVCQAVARESFQVVHRLGRWWKSLAYPKKRRGGDSPMPPPNNWMELTVKIGVCLARRRARRTPVFPAAHPGRYAASSENHQEPGRFQTVLANPIEGILYASLYRRKHRHS